MNPWVILAAADSSDPTPLGTLEPWLNLGVIVVMLGLFLSGFLVTKSAMEARLKDKDVQIEALTRENERHAEKTDRLVESMQERVIPALTLATRLAESHSGSARNPR